MPDPALLLAAIMLLLLIAYALLAGADFGGGVWDLLASGDTAGDQRHTIARVVAPVWEANHVWLIVVVTVLFSGFPSAFAQVSTALHIPIAVALLGIVLRGSAFVFRAYGPRHAGYVRLWGWIFAGASIITPLFLGAIVGAVTEGRIDHQAGSFGALYVDPWRTPFALAVGLFALVLFAYLAAVYLTLEARERPTADAFRLRALSAGALTAVLAATIYLLAAGAPHIRAGLTTSSWAVPLHVATAGAAIAAFVLLWTRRFWWARIAAAAQVSLILAGWALAQYPYLIRPATTIQGSAAPRNVLVLLLTILAAGAVLLLPALWYLFRIFSPVRSVRPPVE